MENSEMKTRSIRADETTLEKFKILSESFSNQGECLSQLITAYEINNAKQVVPNMETDIADYQSHIEKIQQAFLHVLELNHNAEQRIRTEFRYQLDSKDKLIAELQLRSEQAEKSLIEEKEKYTVSVNDLQRDKENLQADKEKNLSDIEQLRHEINSLTQAVEDKQVIIKNLMSRLPEQEETNKIIADLKQQLERQIKSDKEKSEKIIELEREIKDSKKEKDFIIKNMELENKNAVLEVKNEYQIKTEKYVNEIMELQKEITKLKEENIKLKV